MAENNSTDKKQQERTAQFNASVGEEQLSYICSYCGKINPIAAGKCLRCGKRRPRNEYINAINKAKQADSFRDKLSDEIKQAELDRKEAQDMQLVRLVEERVADEKAQIEAQEAVRREQDIDAIQRMAARDAALRVIEAERRADEVIAGQARENEEILRAEREKVLYAAAKRIVDERAGIEQAAEERINLARAEMQKEAQRSIAESVDAVEKEAARRAVMKVIAAEQSSEDRIRLERESSERAAMERIREETDRIAQYQQAKHDAERAGIQRAVEERLRAEREIFGGPHNNGGSVGGPMMPYAGNPQQNPVTIQPLAIVPYLNSQQPLYQYDPNQPRTMYRFVPDPPVAPAPEEETFDNTEEEDVVLSFAPKKKKKCGRVLGFIQVILSAVLIFFAVFGTNALGDILLGGNEILSQIKLLIGGGLTGTDMIFPILSALVAVMAVASLLQGIVRMARGKLAPGGWLLLLILFVLIVASYVVFWLIGGTVASFAGTIWMMVIYMAIAFILFLFNVICEIASSRK